MKKLLWLDDVRDPNDKEVDWLIFSPIGKDINVYWVTSYYEFVNWITLNGLPDGICFDHDLGFVKDPNSDQFNFNGELSSFCLLPYNDDEKTGYDCAKWLVEYCVEHNKKLPIFASQSANPVGRNNILSYLNNYKKHEVINSTQ